MQWITKENKIEYIKNGDKQGIKITSEIKANIERLEALSASYLRTRKLDHKTIDIKIREALIKLIIKTN